jgi:hypothetical protein
VQAEFSVWLRLLAPEDGGFVWDAPQHLTHTERSDLAARLAAADARRSVEGLVQILAEQVRAVADRDQGVGRGLMISVLPRAALGNASEFVAIASGPLADAQTFLYVPPSGDTTIQLGPVTTCGGSILSGFRAEPPSPDSKRPSMPQERRDDPPGLIRRWYLAPIVGRGTTDDPFHAETLGHGGSALIPSRADGHPRHAHALVLVSSTQHADLEADPGILPLADLSDLDTDVSDLPAEKRAWLIAAAESRGVSSDGLAREIVRRIGELLEPTFDERGWWAS